MLTVRYVNPTNRSVAVSVDIVAAGDADFSMGGTMGGTEAVTALAGLEWEPVDVSVLSSPTGDMDDANSATDVHRISPKTTALQARTFKAPAQSFAVLRFLLKSG
jgi:hypothetical protein